VEEIMSLFITFEGGEGSGKTTVIENLYKELNSNGYNIIKTREPGGSIISEQIRKVILDVDNTKMDYRTEALLYAASRRQHLSEIIIPALNKNIIVICDRYLDSSLAYQGYARGLGIKEVYKINQYATEGILPDITFYIDVDPQEGLKRIKDSNRDVDRLDLENFDFHQLVRKGYLEVAAMFPERIKIINGHQTVNEISNQIKDIIKTKL